MIAEECYASNPKDVCGIRKTPFSTLPWPVMAEMGVSMMEGALKYGRHNYRVVGVKASIYFDAFMRHITSWWEGEDIDKESGLPHLVKAMTCLAVYRDAEMRGMVTDDRPPRTLNMFWQLNKKVEELRAKYPNPVPAFTHAQFIAESEDEALQDDNFVDLSGLRAETTDEAEREDEQGNNVEPNSCGLSSVPIRSERIPAQVTQAYGLSDLPACSGGISPPSALQEAPRRCCREEESNEQVQPVRLQELLQQRELAALDWTLRTNQLQVQQQRRKAFESLSKEASIREGITRDNGEVRSREQEYSSL